MMRDTMALERSCTSFSLPEASALKLGASKIMGLRGISILLAPLRLRHLSRTCKVVKPQSTSRGPGGGLPLAG